MSTPKRHYIFGYGSLINSISRSVTGETGQAWPVKVKGFERHWSVISPHAGMSSVAVVEAHDKSCNGVLVEVPEHELPSFDERETGYQRAIVESHQLEPYHDHELPEGTVWIYFTHEVIKPTLNCPIAMSYADVILAGCLEYGDAFTDDFVALTQGWDDPVLNDRQQPRYPRVQSNLATEPLDRWLAVATDLSHQELSKTYISSQKERK